MGFSDARLNSGSFVARRDLFAIGGAFRILDSEGNLLFYSRQKIFKLREDIRIFGDQEMNQELLNIQARQILDFAASYDVVDSSTQQKVGALRRRGWGSITRDHWEILDNNDNPIASIKEDTTLLALIRRFLINIIPQSYSIESSAGESLGTLKQRFNPFLHIFDVDFSMSQDSTLDRRLGTAAVILLLAIEGKQR
ncbi:hypothetical protein ACFL0T_05865 [Candidatus Omnitrophota bacterium]